MIERADADHDGFVSEEEFYNLLTKKYWLWLMLWSFKNSSIIQFKYFQVQIFH